MVTLEEVILFADIKDSTCLPDGVTLRSYEAFWDYLTTVGSSANVTKEKVGHFCV